MSDLHDYIKWNEDSRRNATMKQAAALRPVRSEPLLADVIRQRDTAQRWLAYLLDNSTVRDLYPDDTLAEMDSAANNTPQRMARPSAGATYAGGDGSAKHGG